MTLKEVLNWMLENKDDYEAMEEINRVSYAFMRPSPVKDY